MNQHSAVALRLAWSSIDDDHVAQESPVSPSQQAAWPRATRYSEQPMDLRTRLFGVGGVALIALAVLSGMLITWHVQTKAPEPATLSVFDVSPPAAPPMPDSNIPPGPKEVERDTRLPEPEMSKIEPPEIQVKTDSPILPPPPEFVPEPAPRVEKTTAPEAKPLPPAPRASTAKPTWEGLVLGALNKVKRYPRYAQSQGQQGTPWIRFTMNREGKVLSVRLERSSGARALDEEALALPKRAQPLPKPPEDVAGNLLELVVPVEFFLQ